MKHWCTATTSVWDRGRGQGWWMLHAEAGPRTSLPTPALEPIEWRKIKISSVSVDLMSPDLKKVCTCQSSLRSVCLVLQCDQESAGQRPRTRRTGQVRSLSLGVLQVHAAYREADGCRSTGPVARLHRKTESKSESAPHARARIATTWEPNDTSKRPTGKVPP